MPYYHVQIIQKSTGKATLKLDFTREELEERILAPRRKGRSIIMAGKTIEITDIDSIKITMTVENSKALHSIVTRESQVQASRGVVNLIPIANRIFGKGEDMTDYFITDAPGSEIESAAAINKQPPINTREVFVVHGRNDAARDALFAFLTAIDLRPLEWSEIVNSAGKPSPYIGDILDMAFSRASAVVVLFTPDDEAKLKSSLCSANEMLHETELTGQARPNVLFEAGMAMGRDADRTVLVEIGRLRPFSDLAGRLVVRMDNSSQQRQELARRLQTAGCPVNLEGTAWHKAGDFEAAII